MNGFEKCKVNPEDPGFVKKFKELHPDFQQPLFLDKVPEKSVLTYIVLTFDIESPYVIAHKDWAHRRRITAEKAGFPKDGVKFVREAENIILGKVQSVDRFILRYLFLQNNIKFLKYQSYQFLFYKQIGESMIGTFDNPGNYDKLKNNIDTLAREMEALQHSIFHGDETDQLKDALYGFVSEISMDFTPEDRVEKVENGETPVDELPYKGYEPGEMRFLDDE